MTRAAILRSGMWLMNSSVIARICSSVIPLPSSGAEDPSVVIPPGAIPLT